MSVITLRSFAKINLGLRIGALRDDGFHELHTVYQTIGLHDVVRVELARGNGIELRCRTTGVPLDETNTCHRMAERVLRCAKARGKIIIHIEKKLPVQGGLGAASSNAAAVLLALDRLLDWRAEPERKLELAAEVGSDVPLFLLGGTVLGLGRGEQVYALEDLPATDCVIATPAIGVSTPRAFADWDDLISGDSRPGSGKLTAGRSSARIEEFYRALFSAFYGARGASTGVSAKSIRPSQKQAGAEMSRDRAEPLLLDLVRAGIENDFERVVFPQHPELREVKRVLEHQGAKYASLSGSGSSLYGLFGSRTEAAGAARALEHDGIAAQATLTLSRRDYWKQIFVN